MSQQTVSIAEAKAHLSELIAKNQHAHKRFIITRRNKPVAALVTLQDLACIQQHESKQGLAAIAGKWTDFDEVSDHISDSLRTGSSGRDVSL